MTPYSVGYKETLLGSASRTETTSTDSLENAGRYSGVLLVVDASVVAESETVTPALQVQDGNGDWNAIWTAGAAIAAAGTTSYLLYPGASGGNLTEVDAIPVPVGARLTMTHSSTGAHTYSVLAYWIP